MADPARRSDELGDEHLAAVGQVAEPGRLHHGLAEVVALLRRHLADRDADADLEAVAGRRLRSSTARWTAVAASRAAFTLPKASIIPSPRFLTSRPPAAVQASRSSEKCSLRRSSASTGPIRVASSVEPTRSVNTRLTVSKLIGEAPWRDQTAPSPGPWGDRTPRPPEVLSGCGHKRPGPTCQHGAVLLADLVATSAAVAATRSRTAKVAALADLLRRLEPDEVEPAVGFLTGAPRQGRIGVGWRTAFGVEVRAGCRARRSRSREVDATLSELAVTSGPGSVAARQALLGDAVRAGDRARGRVRPVAADRRAAPGRARRRDDRRRRQGGGRAPRRWSGGRRCSPATSAAPPHCALGEGAAALEAVHLAVLNPIQPMLAASAGDVAEALGHTGPASVEWKLDGARVQVHRDGDEVRIFTRNLNDVTDRLPGIVALGARACRSTSFVLDGEILWLAEDATPKAFQDTMSAFGRDDPTRGGDALLARFFDVLHVDGVDLIDEPLTVRQEHLDGLVGELAVPRAHTDDVGRGPGACSTTRSAHGHEGVMVKALDVDLRGRPPGWVVAQGEAGQDARPRRPRRRVGPRPPAGLAVEPPPRGPRSRGRLRHGRQDLQGPDRRAAHLADRGAAGARGRGATGSWSTCGPSWSSRSPSTACRPAPATRAAWRCASPA